VRERAVDHAGRSAGLDGFEEPLDQLLRNAA
jgi:hypothetical protein